MHKVLLSILFATLFSSGLAAPGPATQPNRIGKDSEVSRKVSLFYFPNGRGRGQRTIPSAPVRALETMPRMAMG